MLVARLDEANVQISQEKAGKRKIFHSLVKLANELKKSKQDAPQQPWYEGGMWRNQVQVLPGVGNPGVRGEEPVSLSDLFLDLVIVTAFTRVGQAISNAQQINMEALLYFAVFWTIWTKEASYSSRFDCRDLSAKLETLLTCFAVLFGSLSASAPVQSTGATRIMMVAAFCAILNCLLHARIAVVFAPKGASGVAAIRNGGATDPDVRRPTLGLSRANETRQHVQSYAIFNVIMTLLEAAVWIVGIIVVPVDHPYRWMVFALGIVFALRVPRAFLANDFHGTFGAIGKKKIFLCWCLTLSLNGMNNSCLLQTRSTVHTSTGISLTEYRGGGF